MEELLNRLSRYGIVAGGAIRDYAIGVSPKDIDCFVLHYPNDLFAELRAEGYKQVRRKFTGPYQIDFVPTKFNDPIKLVESFDQDTTQWWWDHGPQALNSNVESATKNKTTTFWRHMDKLGNIKFRVAKMEARGWSVVVAD